MFLTDTQTWDGDNRTYKSTPDEVRAQENSIKANRRLLNLCGGASEDWPCGVHVHHGCFQVDLEGTLSEEIGKNLFDELVTFHQNAFGFLKKKHALKNPLLISAVLKSAAAQGMGSPTLESLVDAIVACIQSPIDTAYAGILPKIAT